MYIPTLKVDSTIKIECLLTIQLSKLNIQLLKLNTIQLSCTLSVLTTIIPSCRVRDCWRGPCGTKKVERPLQSARLVVLRRPRHQLGAARLQGTSPLAAISRHSSVDLLPQRVRPRDDSDSASFLR